MITASFEIDYAKTPDAMMTTTIDGTVISGLGRGAQFTALGWAKNRFIEKLGIDPWPGTLNIILSTDTNKLRWQTLQDTSACTISDPDRGSCDARCFPVRIADRYAGAIVLPLVDHYPAEQIEIIAPISLRSGLSLRDGDAVTLEPSHPLGATTILFDLDGTLVDTVGAFYMLAKRTGDEFGINMARSHVYNLLNHGLPYWDSVLPDTTPDRQATIAQLNRRAVALWPEVIAEHARIFPGIHDTLTTLKERGYTLGIVTGSSGASLDLLFSAGVRELFDVVISGADVSQRKPHPEGLLKCLHTLHANANDTLYVGDTSIDMHASRAAGVTAVAVLSGAGNSASLCEAGAYRIVRDHSALIDILG